MTTEVPGPSPSSPEAAHALRIHYFDWLRAIAVLGVITYHTLLPFARSSWIPRNAEQSNVLQAVISLLETFGLSVLFLIAGASAFFALQRRSWLGFLAERAKRLLVPFVVGALVIVPLTGYITGLHLGTVSGSFLVYLKDYPSIVAAWAREYGLSPHLLTFVGAHLWFLAWLLLWSVLALPIFAFLSSTRGRSLVGMLARLARWRGTTILFAAPITLPGLLVAPLSSADQGPSLQAFAWYGMIFIVGYLLFSDLRLIQAARRDLAFALIVAVLGSLALLAAGFGQRVDTPPTSGAIYFLMLSLVVTTGWAWTLTVMGVAMRARFMQHPTPGIAAEVAFPAYILHFPIVIAISWLIVQSQLEFGAKIVANALLGVGATLAVTAALLSVSIIRPLLGVRPATSTTVL